jgi:7,8-dihydroneopterin aldolase/epimerase/oxygenase
MDTIFISDFRLDILVGVYDWERKVPQKVQFDLEFALPPRKSPSDKLGDTIDYAAVVSRIEASLAENRFSLLETLAEHIAQLVLRDFKSPWVRVSVTKLAALKNVKRLGVTIERGSRVEGRGSRD